MSSRTGAIGNNDPNNYQTAFKTPVYTGITMESGEYPTKITLNDLVAGGPQWRNNHYSYNLAVWLDLCDADGNNRIRIWTATINKGSSNYTKEFTVPDGQALAGKALYLIMEDTIANDGWDTRDYTVLRYRTVVTVDTEYNNYSISGMGGQGGNWTVDKWTAAAGETITYTATPNAGYSAAAPTTSPAVTMTSAGANKWTFQMPVGGVMITPVFNKITYTVTRAIVTGGTITLSRTTATMGDEITITITPNIGYRLKANSLKTTPARTITNNKFTMPASNVTVEAEFEKITYSITPQSVPSGGGTVTVSRSTATYGDTVTVSQTPAAGYYFDGWETTPANLISNGQFTMPNQNVTVKAKYLLRSTANVNKTKVTDGDRIQLTIIPDKATYSHKYKLSFGTNMEWSLTNVNEGVTSVTLPALPSGNSSWARQIPSAKTKAGTLTVETYNGSTKIGTYTINMTYEVPENTKPTLSAIQTSIIRSLGGVTYADVGNYYVQGHSGVRIQTTGTGALNSKITKIELSMDGGYTGNSYNRTTTYDGSKNSESIDFTTGLLTIAGTITITAKVTDSRGETATVTATITVTQYNAPYGTLSVKRVDAVGADDVLGQYAKYTQTHEYRNIGTNQLTAKIKALGTEASINLSDASGIIFPNNHRTFDRLTEYQIQLELKDSFETTTITAKLPTAQFMLFFNADGTRMALMKAVNSALSKNGKNGVIELSEDAQVYLGQKRIEQLFMPLALNKNSVSSLPTTISDSRITSTMICKPGGMRLSNPGAQRSDWTITTSNGSVTISGTISGSTNIWLWLEEPMT